MRLNNVIKSHTMLDYGQNLQTVKGQIVDLFSATEITEPEALLDLSFDARNSDRENSVLKSLRPQRNNETNTSNIDDPTRRLTRRLVAARTTMQVQTVLRDAFKSMGDILHAAATGDEEAQQILNRLQRLIRRATRKVRDLNSEDDVRRRENQARRREMEQLARKFEEELKRRLAERRRREENYLRDNDSNNNSNPLPGILSGAPVAVQIKAMARLAAQAAVMARSGLSAQAVGGNSTSGGSAGFGENFASISGEGAFSEVDISVE